LILTVFGNVATILWENELLEFPTPFFADANPKLHLITSNIISDMVGLAYHFIICFLGVLFICLFFLSRQ
jgi:hypothetical protein